MTTQHIAALDLVAIHADGTRTPVALRVGAPARDSEGGWHCALRLEGLYGSLPAIHGEDSLQALCLALMCAAAVLRNFIASGGRLIDAEEGEDSADEASWPLEAYFGWLGASRARDV